ncbi:DMT family transporter [Paracoccus sp. (in: a-proteobacteria)]|uniref:DMT family transporter n=1 Tax=Paracoccus sp. TaxID=267 RepID=UPI003A84EBA9
MPAATASPAEPRTGLAILLICIVAFIFAMQDGFSRQLGASYPPTLVVMLRFWVFAVFVLWLVARQPGGLKRAIRTKRPLTHLARGLLLVTEIVVIIEAFVRLGLVQTHSIFAVCPLLVAGLSGPVLGEKVGWRRWTAIGIGFCGILVILQPGSGMMQPAALLPLASALMFALYTLLTRHVSRDDPAMVSFFWTGVAGAVFATMAGIWHWQWLAPIDWLWMAGLCATATLSHYLMIRAYEMAEASALQPFIYTQLVWASLIGILFFCDALPLNVVIGAAIVVSAGLFTLWRTRVRSA